MLFIDESREARTIAQGVFYGLLYMLVLVTISMWMSGVFRGITGIGSDDCDKSAWHVCGANVITDAKTGLQYLSTGHGITPRLGRDGAQLHE